MMTIPSRYTPKNAEGFIAQCNDNAAWRADALSQLKARGLPTPKLERWKYTNIAAFIQSGALLAAKVPMAANPVQLPWMMQNSRKLVFVNGHLALGDARLTWKNLNAPSALETVPMQAFSDAMLWALNTAATADGPQIEATEDGAVFEIIHLGQGGKGPQLASPKSFIKVAPNIKVTLIEQFLGLVGSPVHANHATQIAVGQGANVTHIRIQNEANDRVVLTSTHTTVARDASYNLVFFNAGAALSRQDVWIELEGLGASGAIKGAQLMAGRQHMDTTVQIDHKVANCTSNQTIRNVLAGEAYGVFQGKIHVHQPAQKTDGYQLCNTLMLSPFAQMNTKPELEIYADDVKCSHGATTGKLDDAQLFYLRARGISEAEAKRMLLEAFIGDLYADLPEAASTPILKRIAEWLENV